jgi:FdhD protein
MEAVNLDWARPDPDAYALGLSIAKIWRFDGDRLVEDGDALIEEVPVELRYQGQDPIVMMVTPLDIEDYALGFSITEGIAHDADDVLSIDAVPANAGFYVEITLRPGCAERAASRKRSLPGNSGCGVCGVAEVGHALRLPKALPMGARFAPEAIAKAMRSLPGLQRLGSQTGASHAAAFCSADGVILAIAEDAGRHNALDKLAGMAARLGLDPTKGFCVATSRASYEMAQKAASFGFPMLCAVSGATGEAQRLAKACAMTLCAFARGSGFTCLSEPGRIDAPHC